MSKTRSEIEEIVAELSKNTSDPINDQVLWILNSVIAEGLMSVEDQEWLLWDSAGGEFGVSEEEREYIIAAAPIARKLLGF
jgi:hypothetical protein